MISNQQSAQEFQDLISPQGNTSRYYRFLECLKGLWVTKSTQRASTSPSIEERVDEVNPVRRQQSPLYNDDEPLATKIKQEAQDVEISLQIRAQRSLFKLKETVSLPAMASIKATGGGRTRVDLICVIDNSASMDCKKIQLVKQTMKFLLDTLTPFDRISIITFNSSATRLCPLKNVSAQNLKQLFEIVNGICSIGGTDIKSGLEQAIKTLRDRRQVNEVTSIFLLSDGQDQGADARVKNMLEKAENEGLQSFSIHSFGFGNDHDEEVMRNICQLGGGVFYYIKELETLDEAFCNALGGILSLAANEVVIKLRNVASGLTKGIQFKKIYGSQRSWKKLSEKEYQIKVKQLISDLSKDFVFQLSIPALHAEVGDLNRDHLVIEGVFTAKMVDGQELTGRCELKLTVLNEGEIIPEENQNVDVIENYLRVRAAEAMEENIKLSDELQFEEAKKGIDEMIEVIKSNKLARKEKTARLLEDLSQARSKCSKQVWATEGRKFTRDTQMSLSYQNGFTHSSSFQLDMVQNRQQAKSANIMR